MAQLHATRLDRLKKQRSGFLAKQLPFGTLKRKIVLWVVAPLLVLALLYVVIDDIVMPNITRHGSEFTLPDYADQRLIEARIELDNLNLRFEISSEEFSPGIPQGVILSQYPVAGTKVKTGRIIKFVISAGQKMVSIPDLSGLSVRQALLDLETAGLELGEITWAFSDDVAEKFVVHTYPTAGSEIALGSQVTLMVNHGRRADFTFVPRVAGLTLDEARTILESKQLRIGVVTSRFADDLLPETVLEQSETAGTELDINTEIDLVVSTLE
ncbi:MAG: PASTA domain-containing protein [candidate division Zixibacteria bacterium]|nr:PASTA domain-containing protein [candidate division Zixibacteria bacterium]MDH3937373.1 PASTA domain-containing protein [candidate division Zixibacteria bacterium]